MHQNKHQNTNKQHVPVLLDEVITYLRPQKGETYLDLTAGYGGHASAILQRVGSLTSATLVDRDSYAIAALKERFGTDIDLIQNDFLQASRGLLMENRRYDIILADLGVSSPHLDLPERGFTLTGDGPLDMRMDQGQELTAATIVNTYDEAALRGILRVYGEEPKARQIAAKIVAERPLQTNGQLAAIASLAWPGRSRVHPATRTFQAIRIAVNDELGQLEMALPLWLQLLNPGGRLAVISFHSLEDRLVKTFFKQLGGNRFDAELEILTKKPITATPAEIVSNPRARSAKLRAAAKT